MSTISATNSASTASDAWATRKSQMQAKMFAKADTDGDGSINKTELGAMLAKVGSKTGTSTDASAAFSQMDTDGNAKLSSSELQQGMEKLMPARSTMAFAQAHGSEGGKRMEAFFSTLDANGDGNLNTTELKALAEQVKSQTGADISDKLSQLASDNGGTVSKDAFMTAMRPDGPPPTDAGDQSASGAGGPPPPGGAGGPPPAGGGRGAGGPGGVSGTNASSQTYDPLDTNQDGVVSEMERMVGALSASSSTDSSGTASSGTGTTEGNSTANRFDLAQFASHMYAEMARNWSSSTTATSTLNAVA